VQTKLAGGIFTVGVFPKIPGEKAISNKFHTDVNSSSLNIPTHSNIFSTKEHLYW
jgi:hypothetical protein